MSRAAKSLFVFGVYLCGLGLLLLLAPNLLLQLFGVPPTHEVWIRINGMFVLCLSFYYVQAARNKHLVFVYGTLRQGGVRAMPELFPGAKFVGRAKVRGWLYDFGAYPGLMIDEAGSLVTGEVYEIDDEILAGLDEIEAPAFYERKQIEVALDNQSRHCWIYEPKLELYPQRSLISSGDWIEYAKTKTEWPEDVWPDEAES
jgi:gamma-glutamylcyclotransferase (GGCT)/AIG2-like uncharacterized protein YtfP